MFHLHVVNSICRKDRQEFGDQLLHRGFRPCGDLENLPSHPFPGCGLHHCIDQVVNVDEIPGLVPVPVDFQGFPLKGLTDELGHYTVLAAGSGSVHIPEAQATVSTPKARK